MSNECGLLTVGAYSSLCCSRNKSRSRIRAVASYELELTSKISCGGANCHGRLQLQGRVYVSHFPIKTLHLLTEFIQLSLSNITLTITYEINGAAVVGSFSPVTLRSQKKIHVDESFFLCVFSSCHCVES